MKKVAILLNDLGMGGAERCAVLLAQELVCRGHQVTLVLLRGNANFWGKMPERVKMIDLSADFQGKRFWRWWQALIHIADAHDVLIGGNILVPTYVMYLLGLRRNCQTIAWVHGPMADIDALTPFSVLHQLVGRFIYRRLSHIVFVSTHARTSMSRWLKLPVKLGWQVIYNFVPARATPLPKKSIHAPLRLLFVGRIAPEKSPLLLLEILSKLLKADVPATLTLVGEGESLLNVEAAIKTYALEEHVKVVGSQQQIQPYLDAANFLLLTSQFEGCPLVVLEAMQSALPVISTKAGGVPELLGQLRFPLILEAEANLFSQAIIEAMANYNALTRAMLQRSQAFTAEEIMPLWCKLIGGKDGE